MSDPFSDDPMCTPHAGRRGEIVVSDRGATLASKMLRPFHARARVKRRPCAPDGSISPGESEAILLRREGERLAVFLMARRMQRAVA